MSLPVTPGSPDPKIDGRSSQDGLINSPEINPSGTPTQRSVTSVGMGLDIVNSLIVANSRRQTVNSRIVAKYNAERPYDNIKLKSEGLGWRSNFTTKPLPQMIEKVAPRFEEAVQNLKYLTDAQLSDKWGNSTEKTDYFRKELTDTIRARKGWKTLVGDIALDNALFGFTVVGLLDEFSWMPQHFSQDEAFFPDGTKQFAGNAQIAVLLETYMPHELFDFIKDRESAETVGWNIKNTINAINKASPSQIRNILGNGSAEQVWYQNANRELTVGASYMTGASVIKVYSLLAREVTGKVSHYRFAGDSHDNRTEIFSMDDRFASMEDCLSFFTFQKGNKRLHGSKGVGRDIYELASMQDRMRNEVVDRGILAGKTFVQGDLKQLHKFRMSVVGATVIVPNNWTFLEQKVDGNIDSFLKLDAYFTMLVDQLIGAVSPRTFQGDRVTKAEVDLFASREEEGKDSRITRFLEQFVDMVGIMQRRLTDPETADEDAKKLQERLLKKMSRDEIKELAGQPVAGTIKDLTPIERQMISALAAEKRGNPLYNQRQLEVEDLTARIGVEFADRVLIPQEDPTEEAEQQRMQLLEMSLLSTGQPVPASPRDNHQIHLSVIMPAAEQLAGAVAQGQAATGQLEVIAAHVTEHYNYALQQGTPKEELAEVAQFVKQSQVVLAQLKALDAQAQQIAPEDPAAVAAGGQIPQEPAP